MNITIHTDGGARGNPGPAAVGVVMQRNGETIIKFGKTIGKATNNVAEYTAVIEAISWMNTHKDEVGDGEINFFLDSNLLVNQLNGLFKIKDANLRLLMTKVRELEQTSGRVITYSYTPREKNKEADVLVNEALDQ